MRQGAAQHERLWATNSGCIAVPAFPDRCQGRARNVHAGRGVRGANDQVVHGGADVRSSSLLEFLSSSS